MGNKRLQGRQKLQECEDSLLLKGTRSTQPRRPARLCVLSSLPTDVLGMFYYVKVFPWKRQGHSGPHRSKQTEQVQPLGWVRPLDRGQGKRLLNFRVQHDSGRKSLGGTPPRERGGRAAKSLRHSRTLVTLAFWCPSSI